MNAPNGWAVVISVMLVAAAAGCDSNDATESPNTALPPRISTGLSAGTGASTEGPNTSAGRDVVPAPDAEGPIDELIISRTGMTMIEIRQALDQRIDERIIACAAERGVAVADEELPPGPSESQQVAFGGVVRLIHEQSAAWIAGSSPLRSSPEQAVVDECLISSTADEPDPLLAFFDWLDIQTADANARMESDPRILSDREAAQSCLDERGYSTDVNVLRAGFVDRAQAVLDQARSGQISSEQADDQLVALEAEEADVTANIGPCITAQLEIEQEVRHELEQSTIDQDDAAINEQLDDLTSTLRSMSIEPG